MAKKLNLSYQDIEKALKVFKESTVSREEVGYTLLRAFGKSEADIRRYKEGKGVLTTFDGLLIKGLFCYCAADAASLTDKLESLKENERVRKAAPLIVAVSDGETLLAYDFREADTYENPLRRVHCDFAFFYPLAGVMRVHIMDENPADVKAAEKLAKLHDELRAYNEFTTDDDLHDLNIFIARLLFCFFAEDTSIFENSLFTASIERYTKTDGSDLSDYLDAAFNIMDVRVRNADTLRIIAQFPYVNGGLFAKRIRIPRMGYRARKLIIECGELDWKDINPDIFGSMIQAVVNPDVRANQGMHYTSVPNIMKVINPLFMDDLRESFSKLQAQYDEKVRLKDLGGLNRDEFVKECKPINRACDKLLERMSRMKFFDPACGSGNFLIITYKALRMLEMDIMRLQRKIDSATLTFYDQSMISLSQFYGIELLDFPHEVAMLSLWLAEHQMNRRLHDDFGVNTTALPLKTITQIRCANACRVDWNEVCPHTPDEEVFVFGNPPYLGSALMQAEHKEDLEFAFKETNANWKKYDYITAWFYKGATYCQGTTSSFAFVSTNSICQGEHVPLFWPVILNLGIEISFAYESFKWSNNAKHNAGVTCIVIGCKALSSTPKFIYSSTEKKHVSSINPYLSAGSSLIVDKQTSSISGFKTMLKGSASGDDGHYMLTSFEKKELTSQYPQIEELIKPVFGSQEFIRGEERYCLWITEKNLSLAKSIEVIKDKIAKVLDFRQKSKRENTIKSASTPYAFCEDRYKEGECVIVPRVSSESREYIPIGYLNSGSVVLDSAFAIYDAEVWLFGLLTSKMHMAWVRTVGGKLKTDYRYSAQLCYNTFPFPKITAEKKAEIEDAANEVLDARDNHPGLTLAELYDPEKMPADLRAAHNRLDDIIDSCYPGYPFASDEARLETLFRLYEKMAK